MAFAATYTSKEKNGQRNYVVRCTLDELGDYEDSWLPPNTNIFSLVDGWDEYDYLSGEIHFLDWHQYFGTNDQRLPENRGMIARMNSDAEENKFINAEWIKGINIHLSRGGNPVLYNLDTCGIVRTVAKSLAETMRIADERQTLGKIVIAPNMCIKGGPVRFHGELTPEEAYYEIRAILTELYPVWESKWKVITPNWNNSEKWESATWFHDSKPVVKKTSKTVPCHVYKQAGCKTTMMTICFARISEAEQKRNESTKSKYHKAAKKAWVTRRANQARKAQEAERELEELTHWAVKYIKAQKAMNNCPTAVVS